MSLIPDLTRFHFRLQKPDVDEEAPIGLDPLI